MTNMWGVHNDKLTTELVEGGFVSIGWNELGDLRTIGASRQAIKAALTPRYPERKPQAIAGWAGILMRFRDEMQVGDIVVAPYKPTSTINIGIVAGPYEFAADATTHRHRRPIVWKQVGLSRTVFSQPALYELGAFLTVFGIRKHADEFRAALEAINTSIEEVTRVVEAVAELTSAHEDPDEPRASRIERHTRDYVLENLHRKLTHEEFEEFTADLLRALGYQARVTPYSQDGGVDVIAHRDPLGVEPPLIKVQCKHQTGAIGAPAVQQLIGTQGVGELSLFVTLGPYTREAQAIERQRSGLRLLSGEDVVTLVLQNYPALSANWRNRIPLTPLLVVDDAADS
ncbi:restriction endonuclease [Cellulomonas fengjieae]|uniref:restriction endonuclease n=1 Tax=Cellulomonas fengjieae TaxID=2819978 RepID=UPI001AAF586C|nr:restriction endonuclease [Cellulomonas fengjieae]MBO3102577.1 restriction endonuclease [Cellulomonas fengjieae]